MRRYWSWSVLLTAALVFSVVPVWPQGEGKTLRQVLVDEQPALDVSILPNRDKVITSGAELDDAAEFMIAYYVKDSKGVESTNFR